MFSRVLPDPLLKILPSALRDSPIRLALTYAALASLTSFASSFIEGLFITGEVIVWRNEEYHIRPFIHNFSTIIDFLLLNPLLIYYVQSSRKAMESVPGMSRHNEGSKRWSTLLPIACMVAAVTIMWVYYKGFLLGDFFDAIIRISPEGDSFITITGWTVFIWTSIAIYYILIGVVNQAIYCGHILTLTSDEIRYNPTHQDQVAGVRVFAEPSLYFVKFSIALLVVFLLFAVYDYLVFNVAESSRIWCLPAYLAIVGPLSMIPILSLHQQMKNRRLQLLQLAMPNQKSRMLLLTAREDRREDLPFSAIADELNALDSVRQWILRQPTWPLPFRTLNSIGAYFASLILPVIPTLIKLILASFGVAWNLD